MQTANPTTIISYLQANSIGREKCLGIVYFRWSKFNDASTTWQVGISGGAPAIGPLICHYTADGLRHDSFHLWFDPSIGQQELDVTVWYYYYLV